MVVTGIHTESAMKARLEALRAKRVFVRVRLKDGQERGNFVVERIDDNIVVFGDTATMDPKSATMQEFPYPIDDVIEVWEL